MDYLTKLLAQLFDNFKAKNPKIASIILLVIGILIYAINNGLGDILGHDLSVYSTWILIAYGFLTGTRTTQILNENKK